MSTTCIGQIVFEGSLIGDSDAKTSEVFHDAKSAVQVQLLSCLVLYRIASKPVSELHIDGKSSRFSFFWSLRISENVCKNTWL